MHPDDLCKHSNNFQQTTQYTQKTQACCNKSNRRNGRQL